MCPAPYLRDSMSKHYVIEQPKQAIHSDGSQLFNLFDCEVVYPGGLPPCSYARWRHAFQRLWKILYLPDFHWTRYVWCVACPPSWWRSLPIQEQNTRNLFCRDINMTSLFPRVTAEFLDHSPCLFTAVPHIDGLHQIVPCVPSAAGKVLKQVLARE